MGSVRTGPADYTEGLGEVIRGYRLYTGLSREGMALKLGMAVRSYERIEDGGRGTACPPGLFDTLEGVVNEFDKAVDTLLKAGLTTVTVLTDPRREWQRCVANRASVEHESITPVLTRTTRRDKHVSR
jgi:transcriptional regulator with XRE-family HTH domain